MVVVPLQLAKIVGANQESESSDASFANARAFVTDPRTVRTAERPIDGRTVTSSRVSSQGADLEGRSSAFALFGLPARSPSAAKSDVYARSTTGWRCRGVADPLFADASPRGGGVSVFWPEGFRAGFRASEGGFGRDYRHRTALVELYLSRGVPGWLLSPDSWKIGAERGGRRHMDTGRGGEVQRGAGAGYGQNGKKQSFGHVARTLLDSYPSVALPACTASHQVMTTMKPLAKFSFVSVLSIVFLVLVVIYLYFSCANPHPAEDTSFYTNWIETS